MARGWHRGGHAVGGHTGRLVLPGMMERRYGRIINVASLAALVPAPAGHTLYAPAKALVVRFSEALAQEALKLMNERKITCLFITVPDDRRPLGILHMHDCLRAGVI